jgi:hypothetical protein
MQDAKRKTLDPTMSLSTVLEFDIGAFIRILTFRSSKREVHPSGQGQGRIERINPYPVLSWYREGWTSETDSSDKTHFLSFDMVVYR